MSGLVTTMPCLADGLAGSGGSIPVIGIGFDVHVHGGDERVERGHLILRERLGGKRYSARHPGRHDGIEDGHVVAQGLPEAVGVTTQMSCPSSQGNGLA